MIRVSWLAIGFVFGVYTACTAHAAERPTLGQCMAASAMAGAHNYEWQEKKFSREDCEAITNVASKAAEVPADLQKPDPVEIHIHNPPPPAPVIIQKPSPTINIHIHNEGVPATIGPQSTLSDAPATNLKNAHTPRNRYVPRYVQSDARPDLFLLPPRCCNDYWPGGCDPYYGAGCAH